MHLANEGDHVVFTEAEDLDIFDNHQFVVVLVKDSTIDQIPHILFVAFREVHESFRVPFRRSAQTFSLRVLADTFEDGSNSARELVETSLGFFGCLIKSFAGSKCCKSQQIFRQRGGILQGQLSPSKSMGGFSVYGLAGREMVVGVGGASSLLSRAGTCGLEDPFASVFTSSIRPRQEVPADVAAAF